MALLGSKRSVGMAVIPQTFMSIYAWAVTSSDTPEPGLFYQLTCYLVRFKDLIAMLVYQRVSEL